VLLLAESNIETEEKEPGRIEFSLPLLIIRTKVFSGFFNRIGSLRTSGWISWIALIIVPIVAAIGLFFFCSSLFTLLWTPMAREVSRQLGPASYILLPGINPMLPIFYGWLALISAIVIHEGAHGIIARNRGLTVKSSGLLFFLIIPIGAFVDVDEKEIKKAKSKNSLRVMAAGVAGNIIVALACLLALFLIINGLTPVVDGVHIYGVEEDLPAENAGLLPGDVFVKVDNLPINDYNGLVTIFQNKNVGDSIQVTVARGENYDQIYSTDVSFTEHQNRTIIGVSLFDPKIPLNNYKTITFDSIFLYIIPPTLASGLVPFSDSLIPFYTNAIGSEWHVFANIFFWIWFVNVNVAVFNALPIYPLDGGRMFDISIKSILSKKINEKTLSKITYTVTGVVISFILLFAIVPYIF
jgi:membrane-associated protease RseP (regulator of RpoE activity)